ncbi:hypothetical protein [Hanstruepera ponticola]|uniref:hypothetical protein n=1 Tax=Hanstruepera ponticola TaxID=2042995 RepID=UPI00177D1766|nr:hypothetical protein [Hanstruepera ponticola]
MKKQVLLFTVLLMGLTAVTATENYSVSSGEDLITRYRYAQPILFVERGVEFMIFPDGSFDFNTNVVNNAPYSDNYYYRSSTTITRRGSVNSTFGAPGTVSRVHFSTPRDRGVIIQHDRDGKVRRIGNVFINYDRFGKIKRAGSVYMQYNRRSGLLTRVGGLTVQYNRFGEIMSTFGFVNPFSIMCGVCGAFGCTTNHNSHFDTHGNNWDDDWNTDEDFYYYKQNGKVKKQKKLK